MFDYDRDSMRRQIRRRYNRRFAIIAHLVIFVLSLPLVLILPVLSSLPAILFVLLLPHGLYFAYSEYRDWLADRVERELHGDVVHDDFDKRKRYPEESAQSTGFRLSDDGELEPIGSSTSRRRSLFEMDEPEFPQRRDDRSSRKRYDYDKKRRRKDDDDTDEFDVKRLLKKLKDIID